MSKITHAKQARWNGHGFKPAASPIVIANPYNSTLLPKIVCHSPGELVNWRTREKKAWKRLQREEKKNSN